MADTVHRTINICDQLQRYAGSVYSDEFADILDVMVDINDDLWNMRDIEGIRRQIDQAKTLLDKLFEAEVLFRAL